MANECEALDDLIDRMEAEESGRIVAADNARRAAEEKEVAATPTPAELANGKTPKETALQLVQLGFIVVPSAPCGWSDRNDWCKPGKSPIGAWKDKTKPSYCVCKTKEDVERQWDEHPAANVGVMCGGESGVYCLDIDRKEKDGKMIDGFKTLRELGHDLEKEIPPTIVSQTPSGGWHVYFKCSGDRKIWETQDFLPGLDIRGEKSTGGIGGFAVEAPSSYRLPSEDDLKQIKDAKDKGVKNNPAHSIALHGEIRHYQWIHAPGEYEIMECPDWLLDLAGKSSDQSSKQELLLEQREVCQGNLADETSQNFKDAVKTLGLAPISIPGKNDVRQPDKAMLLAVRCCRFNFGLNREATWKALNARPSEGGKSWNERCVRADLVTPWPWTRDEFDHKFDSVEEKPGEARILKTNTPAKKIASPLPLRFGELQPSKGRYHGSVIFSDQLLYHFSADAHEETEICQSIYKARVEAYRQWAENHAREEEPGKPNSSDLGNMTRLIVVLWLRSRGQFYENKETKLLRDCLYFDKKLGKLKQIESGEFRTFVSNSGNFIREDKPYKQLFAYIQDAAMHELYTIKTVPSAFVARRGNVVYISNGESRMAKCSGGNVEMVANGTDGVLFLNDATLKEWRLLPPTEKVRDPFTTIAQFRDLSYDSWYGIYNLRSWFLNQFAGHSSHTPILFTGQRNSGKSHVARGLQTLAGFPLREASIDPKKEEDFWVSMNAPGLLFFDNLEEEVLDAKWFSSALEKVTTGGSKEVRQLYTQKFMAYESTAQLMLASKVPHYAANEGVAHRFVVIMLNANIKVFKEAALMTEILERRDESMTWIARTVAKALVTEANVPDNINERYPDFGEFAAKCGIVLGDYENTLKALNCGEFEKSRICLEQDETAHEIFHFLVEKQGVWKGYASHLVMAIDPNVDENEKRKRSREYGNALAKLRKPFEVCFGQYEARKLHGSTYYEFKGINELLVCRNGDQ